MSEEEAIEYIKGYKYDNEVRQAIDIVLNLIKNSISKDKIRDKIKELEEQVDDLLQNGDVYNDNLKAYNFLKTKIDILEELLGE